MTAVPDMSSSGVQLICDGCGEVASTTGCGLHDADVVYVAVAAIGWTGTAFARGPHHCPRCSTSLAPAGRRKVPPAAAPERVAVETTPTAAVVRIAGDVDLDVAAELRAAFETAAASRPYVIADLSRAATIDSLGLGTVVRARNMARRQQSELLLAGPSRFVRTVLRTMRLHTAFRTFATVRQALAATEHVDQRYARRRG